MNSKLDQCIQTRIIIADVNKEITGFHNKSLLQSQNMNDDYYSDADTDIED